MSRPARRLRRACQERHFARVEAEPAEPGVELDGHGDAAIFPPGPAGAVLDFFERIDGGHGVDALEISDVASGKPHQAVGARRGCRDAQAQRLAEIVHPEIAATARRQGRGHMFQPQPVGIRFQHRGEHRPAIAPAQLGVIGPDDAEIDPQHRRGFDVGFDRRCIQQPHHRRFQRRPNRLLCGQRPGGAHAGPR
ncbi:hypothetical protein OH818_19325 [Jiella pelagia]|uniref:Uncharacterized protein n=1 Tax=Jiella pelagia TaxID=2986949 RepID=A0ABY7CCB4_9HYPH|nr:hypothetical protein [Jiella pelagia]WAP71375.1 hypothetical protein OH818_19325 [Jiella pelagia]